MKATVLLLSTFVLSCSALADETSATRTDLQLIENERVLVELTNDRLDRATLLRSFKVGGATQAGEKVALLDQLPSTVRLQAEGVSGGAAPEIGRTKSGPAVRFAIGGPVPAAAGGGCGGAPTAPAKAASGCGSTGSGCGATSAGRSPSRPAARTAAGAGASADRAPAARPKSPSSGSCSGSAPGARGCGSCWKRRRRARPAWL